MSLRVQGWGSGETLSFPSWCTEDRKTQRLRQYILATTMEPMVQTSIQKPQKVLGVSCVRCDQRQLILGSEGMITASIGWADWGEPNANAEPANRLLQVLCQSSEIANRVSGDKTREWEVMIQRKFRARFAYLLSLGINNINTKSNCSQHTVVSLSYQADWSSSLVIVWKSFRIQTSW